MMTTSWKELTKGVVGAVSIGLMLLGIGGCDSGTEDPDEVECRGGACDTWMTEGFDHRWALDIQKIQSMGRYSNNQRFVGAPGEEVGLPAELAAVACEREKVINSDGSIQDGGCFLWGNTQRRNYDHSLHVDDPANHPIVNIVDNGQMIDPPGYLNIIAQLNAERHEQTEVRNYLRNGDILVYFHPEDQDTTQFRMHHAAMFYDTGEGPLAISLDGVPFVHHVDNPVSYGPAFNAGPTMHPFHVYRFNPNGAPNTESRDADGHFVFPCTEEISGPGGPAECQAGDATFTITDDMAAQYSYMARNWALITNGHAPFSSFHYMSWNDEADRAAQSLGVIEEVDRYAMPALQRGETPQVYCAGLVYTNLNLALNRPLNQDSLGPMWDVFQGNSYEFTDRYMNLGVGQNDARTALSAAELQDAADLPSLGQLVFEPITASDIVDAWLEGYFGRLPRDVRAQILGGNAQQIAAGFRSLVWAAGKAEEAEDTVVATPERVQAYAMAYAAGDQDLHTITVQDHQLVVQQGPDGQPDLPQMKELELEHVDNRYVPPPLYHVLANREGSMLSYVGTVFHVDLLTPINDNEGETGTGGVAEFSEGGPDTSLYEHYFVPNAGRHAQRIFEVSNGPGQVGHGSVFSTRISAADIRDVRVVLHPAGTFAQQDSSNVCDRNADCIGDARGIAVPLSAEMNGGATAWDDVTVLFNFFSPVEEGGLGCVMVGEIAGTWEDVQFTNGEMMAVLDMANNETLETLDNDVNLDRRAAEAIVAARPIGDMDQLAAVYYVGPRGLDRMREYVPTYTGREKDRFALCPAYDWATGESITDPEQMFELTDAYGQWSMTMIDLGQHADSENVPNCASCLEGGGHSNQWFLILRDDEGETVPDPTE